MTLSPADRPVAVVGAGWAGLSAALALAQRGLPVQLFDAAPQAGGRARALTLELLGVQRRLDNGQHLLIGGYDQTRAVRARAHEILGQTAPAETLQPFRLRSVDGLDFRRQAWADQHWPWRLLPQAGTALGLLLARGLGWRDKLAFGRLEAWLRRADDALLEGRNVQWLMAQSRQPAGLVSRLWDPLCVSALNTGLEQACARTFVQVLRDSLLQQDGQEGPSGPAGSKASDYLLPQDDLSSEVVDPVCRAFSHLGGKLQLRQTIRALDQWPARAWVLAVPPPAAAQLLAPVVPTWVQTLSAFEYESITTVYLAWPESLAGRFPSRHWPSPLLLREAPAEQAWGQWLFDRGFEGGIHVAAVVVSARGRLAHVDTDPLCRNIADQVQRQTGLPRPQAWRAITEKRATIRCAPSRPRFEAKDLLLPSAEGPDGIGPIALAGDYTYSRYPATLESAVRSGLLAAHAIVRALQA